jgi:hypothetical protein
MEPKHKKILVICGVVFFGSYIVRNIVTVALGTIYQYERSTQIARRKQETEAQKQQPPPPQVPPQPQPPAPAQQLPRPVIGTPAAPAQVLINGEPVTPEVENQPKPPALAYLAGNWQGRGVLPDRGICVLAVLVTRPQEQFTAFATLSCNRLGAESAIFEGGEDKGDISMKVTKTIGASNRGCAFTSLTLTPFAAQLAAKWAEPNCGGGHLLLTRVLR